MVSLHWTKRAEAFHCALAHFLFLMKTFCRKLRIVPFFFPLSFSTMDICIPARLANYQYVNAGASARLATTGTACITS